MEESLRKDVKGEAVMVPLSFAKQCSTGDTVYRSIFVLTFNYIIIPMSPSLHHNFESDEKALRKTDVTKAYRRSPQDSNSIYAYLADHKGINNCCQCDIEYGSKSGILAGVCIAESIESSTALA